MNRRSGFTLMEVVLCSAVLLLMLTIVGSLISRLARGTHEIGRAAFELSVCSRFSERFRNDVRQAQSVAVGATGETVSLTVAGRDIEYRRGEDGRMARVSEDDVLQGPRVQSATFALEESRGLRLLRARWAVVEGPLESPQQQARTLVMDTALRAAPEIAP